MEEKKERNQQIIFDKKNGKTFRDLSVKYGLSIERIRQILNREKMREMEEKYAAK